MPRWRIGTLALGALMSLGILTPAAAATPVVSVATTTTSGAVITTTGKVTNGASNQTVALQLRVGTSWVRLAKSTLTSTKTYTLRAQPKLGLGYYRVRLLAAGTTASAVSKTISFAGRLNASPSAPVSGEALAITGRLPTRVSRPVVLQRYTSPGWATLLSPAASTSDSVGRFAFKLSASPTTYRAYAPARTVNGRSYPSFTSPSVVVRPVAQSVTLTGPQTAAANTSFTLTASASPARPGRQVMLQRLTSSSTANIGTASQNGTGTARFTAPAISAPTTYRAVVSASNGAPQVVSDQVTVTPPPDPSSTWSVNEPTTLLPLSGNPRDVSCPTATFCVAVDGHGAVITYDGSTWDEPVPGNYHGGFSSVSCPTTDFCVAVGSGYFSTYDGTSWTAGTVGATDDGFGEVSCATTDFCVAGNDRGKVSIYNGTSWSPQVSLAAQESITALSCSSDTHCVAGDTRGYAYRFNGSTWSAGTQIYSREINSVSCSSADFCVAVAGSNTAYGVAITFNGIAWSEPLRFGGSAVTYDVADVSCTSRSFCMVIDERNYGWRFDGTNWTSTGRIEGYSVLVSVSCASSTFCVTIDRSGPAATFNGATWALHGKFIAPLVEPFNSVSCPTASFCLTVEGGGNRQSEYSEGTWSEPRRVSTSYQNGLKAISCASQTWCAANAGVGQVETYDGAVWTTLSPGVHSGEPSCFDDRGSPECLQIDGSGGLNYISGSFSEHADVGLTDRYWRSSCPTSAFCMFVSSRGDYITANLRENSTPIFFAASLEGVDCTSATFCVTVDALGQARTFNGSTWSDPTPVGPSSSLSAVSCSSPTACAALHIGGSVVTFNGATWSTPLTVLPDGEALGISCPPDDNICAVVGNSRGRQAAVILTHP